MNMEQRNAALDNALDADFSENTTCSVPMVVPEKKDLPAEVTEQQKEVKQTLYDTSNKLTAVLDYYVNNLEELSQPSGVALVKTTPVSDICAIAREIGLLNDKLYKYSQPQVGKPISVNTREMNQTNITFNGNKDEKATVSVADIDKLLKTGEVK